jgi:hypothetical protein
VQFKKIERGANDMGKNMVKINRQIADIKIWNGERVLTFADIDKFHKRVKGTASRNFKANKKKFTESVDYYLLTPIGRKSSIEENIEFSTHFEKSRIPPRGITILTYTGYLMLVKTLTDDLSWEIQRTLINNYFLNNNVTQDNISMKQNKQTQTNKQTNNIPKIKINNYTDQIIDIDVKNNCTTITIGGYR